MVKNKKNILSLSILGIVLVVLCLLSIRFGSAKMTSGEFLLSLSDFRMKTPQGIILYSIRLPRMLGAVVAGMGLGMSGAILQTVTGNRMASPNLAGVNSGAGFGVIVCLSLFPNLFVFVPVFAFAGAFISTLVIAAISKKIGMTKGTLILVGLAFSSILSAGISLISLIDTDALVSYNFFSIGSLSGVKMQELIFPAFMVAVCLVASLIISRRIDILSLGDVTAHSLGISVSGTRITALIIASACASSVVSFAGLLGFAGLMAPHIARRFVSHGTRMLVPASALTGACIVSFADILGRVLFAPSEIPVGILMALTGAPFFLWILVMKGERNDA